MRNRFDQIGKGILRGALGPGGIVASQLEIPSADAQAVDTWFEPDPAREASLRRAGLLGRMAPGPTMFETFRNTPGVDDLRDCLRKQLALDHARALEARKRELPRPAFPRLWLFSTGRPEGVLRGYGMVSMPGFPVGFYEGPEALSVGVVVLRELLPDRETLLLRIAWPMTHAAASSSGHALRSPPQQPTLSGDQSRTPIPTVTPSIPSSDIPSTSMRPDASMVQALALLH